MTRFSYPRRLVRSLRRVATRYSPSRAIQLALPIARHLRGGQSWVATGCGDHVLIVDATDIYIGGSIMTSGSYGRREFDRAIELLRRNDRLHGQLAFLDVGANGEPGETGERDWLWNNYFDVIVGPHPALTASQQKVVAKDYGLDHGKSVLSVRYAMLFYVLKRLGLLGDASKQSAHTQHIVTINRKETEAALEKSGLQL